MTNRILTLAALVPALGLMACEAPQEDSDLAVAGISYPALQKAGLVDLPDSDSRGFGGFLVDLRGDAVVGAAICVDGTSNCVDSGDDGAFYVSGLEEGVSELLIVRSPDHIPLLLPVEGGNLPSISPELTLTPSHHGMVSALQFQAARQTARGPVRDLHMVWTAEASGRGVEHSTHGTSGAISHLEQGTYDVRFETETPALCARVTGWSGPDATSVTVPVRAGAITYVEHRCFI
ncbi:MAG: hypothetical protein KDA24_26775 [Deltaproteobacteria bacterium]|nr:hypothetical protein [Deltaproteobacteria bacterium]